MEEVAHRTIVINELTHTIPTFQIAKEIIDNTTEEDVLLFIGHSPSYFGYFVSNNRKVIFIPFSGKAFYRKGKTRGSLHIPTFNQITNYFGLLDELFTELDIYDLIQQNKLIVVDYVDQAGGLISFTKVLYLYLNYLEKIDTFRSVQEYNISKESPLAGTIHQFAKDDIPLSTMDIIRIKSILLVSDEQDLARYTGNIKIKKYFNQFIIITIDNNFIDYYTRNAYSNSFPRIVLEYPITKWNERVSSNMILQINNNNNINSMASIKNSKESIKIIGSEKCKNIVYRYPIEKCPYKCMPSVDCKKYVRKTKEKKNRKD